MEALSELTLEESHSDQLMGELDVLLAQQTQKSELPQASSSTLSSEFPPSVIASIASLALKSPEGLMTHDNRLSFRNLRSVSRLWRTTLFSTSDLWRGISLGTGGWSSDVHDHESQKEDLIRRLTSWFARAGPDARLSLEIIPTAPESATESPIIFSDLLPLLCSPSLNFVDLRFPVTGLFSLLDTLRHSEGRVFPTVERLTLRAHMSDLRRPQHSITDLTFSFPHLESLHIIDTLSIKVAHATVPQLSFQRIAGGVGSLAPLIGRCPALTTIRIIEDVPGKPWPEMHRTAPSLFPNITRLFLSGTVSPRFIADVGFPSLKILSIDDMPCSIGKPEPKEKPPWSIGSIHYQQPTLMLAFRLMGMPPGVINFLLCSKPSNLTLHFGPGCASRYVRLYTELMPYVRRIQIRELEELIPDDTMSVRMNYPSGIEEIEALKRVSVNDVRKWHDRILLHAQRRNKKQFPVITLGFHTDQLTFTQ